jgi:tetratricopeptide (TPR) repeat protein
MAEMYAKKDRIHLMNLIKKRINSTPNFALLVGGGASVSSGVKPTSQMIAEWRQQLYRQSGSTDNFAEWLKTQDWYEDEEEYSILFEKLYDRPSQRRIYVEECVKDAKPSWGYIYLANIIAHNYFNVVFTPNFDDLLNEACFMYANCRPIVCSHDSAVADIRVTSLRPKIIKLHGDFLYDSIKNTIGETVSLEKNMQDKFMQFAREYGLVVVGYRGNDRSIMDILDMMIRSEGYLPHGLYWCIHKGSKVSKKLDRLLRREKVYLVEIDGFDEFMAELHKELELALPDAVRDPYKATTDRLNRFIVSSKDSAHPVIKKDVTELEHQIKGFEKAITRGARERLVPNVFLGEAQFAKGNYKEAAIYFEKESAKKPNDISLARRLVYAYWLLGDREKAAETSQRFVEQNPDSFDAYVLKGNTLIYLDPEGAIATYGKALEYSTTKTDRGIVLGNRSNALLIVGKIDKALADAEEAIRINPKDSVAAINMSIALKRMGRKEDADRIVKETLPIIEDNPYLRACAYAILGEKEKMLEELGAAIKRNKVDKINAKYDPDFADFREDPDFCKLLSK